MTFLLLYIILSRFKLVFFYQNIAPIHFNFHLKVHLLSRLSLNCLGFDLFPTFLVFVEAQPLYHDNLKYEHKLYH